MDSTACTTRGGISSSATGRRFSRSPLMSEVSTGVSSTTLSRLDLPSSIRSTRSGGRGGVFGGGPFLTAAGRWKTTRTVKPLISGLRGVMAIEPGLGVNSPGRSGRSRSA